MIHPDGYGAARPIDVPILIGADGPRGTAAAAELGDGAFAAGLPNAAAAGRWSALLQFGTVLDDGEDPACDRVVEVAGPAMAVALHAMYERGGPPPSTRCPAGRCGGRRSRPSPRTSATSPPTPGTWWR